MEIYNLPTSPKKHQKYPISNVQNVNRTHRIKNNKHENASVGLAHNFSQILIIPYPKQKTTICNRWGRSICVYKIAGVRPTIIFNTSSTAAANAQAKNNSKNVWHARSLGQCKFNNNGNPQCPRMTKSKYTFFQH